eukprot:258410_1
MAVLWQLNWLTLLCLSCQAQRIYEITPDKGTIGCNETINGKILSNNTNSPPIDGWKFDIPETLGIFSIDSCSSTINTTLSYWRQYVFATFNSFWTQLDLNNCKFTASEFNQYYNMTLNAQLSSTIYIGVSIPDNINYSTTDTSYSLSLTCIPGPKQFYVSQNGTDYENCGLSIYVPCGTLYYTSKLVYVSNTEIYIIDGQNEGTIQQYIDGGLENTTNGHHPCLPIPNYIQALTLTFDESNIINMEDWYPDICLNVHLLATNQYAFMFAGYEMVFNNLKINDYQFNPGVFPQHVADEMSQCNNCQFINIAGCNLFNVTQHDIIFNDAVFHNISVNHEWNNTNCHVIRSSGYTMINTDVSNINDFAQFVISTDVDNNDKTILVNITNTSYSHCNVNNIFVNIGTDISDVVMNNVMFDNINIGFNIIYVTDSKLVEMNNITVITSQTIIAYSVSDDMSLFYFGLDFVSMTSIYVHFNFNLHEKYLFRGYGPFDIAYLQTSMPKFIISNAIKFDLTDLYISSNITNQSLYEFREYLMITYFPPDSLWHNDAKAWKWHYQFQLATASYFIENRLIMNLKNIYFVDDPLLIHRYFTYNRYILNIDNVMFSDNILYGDPNLYLPLSFTINAETISTMNLTNAIIGFYDSAILFETGALYMDNVTFINTKVVIEQNSQSNAEKAILNNVRFINCGKFYGHKWYGYSMLPKEQYSVALDFAFTRYLSITNSLFDYYDDNGMIKLPSTTKYGTEYTLIKNSTFISNTNNILYNITSFDDGYYQNYPDVYGVLSVDDGSGIVQLISNTFKIEGPIYNTQSIQVLPWIYINSDNIHCIYGNYFENYAIQLEAGIMTSCRKPNLMNCLSINNCCSQSIVNSLGLIDKSVMPQNQTFRITNGYDSSVIKLGRTTKLILDNSYIEVSDSSTKSLSFTQTNNIESSLLMVDTIFVTDTVDINYDALQCNIPCYKKLNTSTGQLTIISQVSIICYSSKNGVQDIQFLSDYDVVEFVSHLSPYGIMFNEYNDYYPGGLLYLSFEIVDKLNNMIIDTNNSFTNVTVNVEINALKVQEDIPYGNSDNVCTICENGIYLPLISVSNVGESYLVNAADVSGLLVYNEKNNISIIHCPSGYGTVAVDHISSKVCHLCPVTYYNLDNSDSTCLPCNDDDNYGITCPGADNIVISNDYWMTIDEKNSDNSLITAKCPTNYCCKNVNGCNWHKNVVGLQSNLCAANRDYTVALCGKCLDGYSELIGSVACGECNRDHVEFLLWPLFVGTLITFYYFYTKATSLSKQSNDKGGKLAKIKKFMNSNFAKLITVMFTKGIIYYEQSVSQILSGSPISSLITFVNLFNLSIQIEDDDGSSGLCFIQNMNAEQKILSGLLIIGYIILLFVISYLFSIKWNHIFVKYIFRDTATPNFIRSFIGLFLIIVGKILTVLFQILACVHFSNGDQYVHFYMGYKRCYQGIWFFAFAVLLIIVLIFIGLFYILKYKIILPRRNTKHDATTTGRNTVFRNNNMSFESLIYPYKAQYYYFEIVLFSRRVIVAFLAISFHNEYSQFILVMVVLFYCFLQYECQPFIQKEMNQFELVLLFSMILLIVIQGIFKNQGHSQFASSMTVLLIIFPIILWMVYICVGIWKRPKQLEPKDDILKQHELELNRNVDGENDNIVEVVENTEMTQIVSATIPVKKFQD